jgi:hypothetical protein
MWERFTVYMYVERPTFYIHVDSRYTAEVTAFYKFMYFINVLFLATLVVILMC